MNLNRGVGEYLINGTGMYKMCREMTRGINEDENSARPGLNDYGTSQDDVAVVRPRMHVHMV